MADPNFNLAAVDELNDVVRALARIYAKVRDAVGDDAAQEAFDLGLEALDDDDPSVSDLEPIAEQVDVDLSDLLDGDGCAGSGGGAGDDAAAASATASTVSLTANTRNVATSHGLPTNWQALAGIDLPPSLADVPMSDRGLAAAINKAHGVDGPGDRVATPSSVRNVRDKGGERGSFGVQVEDFESDDAGLDNKLGVESPLPVQTAKNRVESHLSRTGKRSPRSQSGVSLDDLDGE